MSDKGGVGLPFTEYFMTIFLGLCQGPVESLRRVYLRERLIWEGERKPSGDFDVSNPEAWGGPSREGGYEGKIVFHKGTDTENLHNRLAAKLETGEPGPDYRGITCVGFMEQLGAENAGFYWQANSPYLPTVWFTVSRFPGRAPTEMIWQPAIAAIGGEELELGHEVYVFAEMSNFAGAGPSATSMRTITMAVNNHIKQYIEAGVRVRFGVCYFSDYVATLVYGNYGDGSLDYENMNTFINETKAAIGLTDYEVVANEVANVFTESAGEDRPSRTVIFLSAGGDVQNAGGTSIVSDHLDQTSGAFAGDTAINFYAFIVNNNTEGQVDRWDNTPRDGIPRVDADDYQEVLDALDFALKFTDLPDSNPAHIIRECLTNKEWGMGASDTLIDQTSFVAAAQALYDEQFGLSMIWTQQDTIENFVQEVLDHIRAVLFIDPRTGKFVLKLIRDDYVFGDLRILDETNSTITEFTRRGPGDIVNEIVVTWTDPGYENEQTYTIQNLGAIEALGGEIISNSRNYYGIRSGGLARKVAERDITEASAPLASVEATVDRSAWNIVPGEVVRVTSAEHGISDLVMRVGRVDYGKPGSSAVQVALVEDIWSLVRPEAADPPQTESPPRGAWAERLEHESFMTMPFYLAARMSGLQAEPTSGEVMVGTLGSTSKPDTINFVLFGDYVDAAGNESFVRITEREIIARATLGSALDAEPVTSYNSFLNVGLGRGPRVGGFALIGPDDLPEDEQELCLIESFDGVEWRLQRGILDTVPQAWPAETPIRFFSRSSRINDLYPRDAGVEVDYKFLTRTSYGVLPSRSAPFLRYTPTDRPYKPLRPASVAINGVSFPASIHDLEGVDPIPVTWATRNRLREDSQILFWDEASITPETDQTTTITILDYAGAVITTIDGLTGSSYDLPVSAFGGASRGFIRVTSKRDGYESIQGYQHEVRLGTGYGFAYGFSYGT